ncbi:MAG TPA: hypothetical protein VFS88_06035, partial [Micavibrio sp.]|nr:hypothetical protein [Micavibrio sp.]
RILLLAFALLVILPSAAMADRDHPEDGTHQSSGHSSADDNGGQRHDGTDDEDSQDDGRLHSSGHHENDPRDGDRHRRHGDRSGRND